MIYDITESAGLPLFSRKYYLVLIPFPFPDSFQDVDSEQPGTASQTLSVNASWLTCWLSELTGIIQISGTPSSIAHQTKPKLGE